MARSTAVAGRASEDSPPSDSSSALKAVPPPKKAPTPAGLSITEPSEEDRSWAQDLAEKFAEKGPHPDYKKFAASTKVQTDTDAFTFIADACDSEGGFADGTYLDPHTREQAAVLLGITGSITTSVGIGPNVFEARKRLAYYDNFSRTIRDTAWGIIQQSKDTIHRESLDPALEDFWQNTDGQGVSIDDFNEEPQQQAQMFGHGVVIVDRPSFEAGNLAADQDPENAPYAYVVPSKNVVRWVFDESGELSAIAFVEPGDDADEDQNKKSDLKQLPLKVWTRACWASFEPAVEDVAAKKVAGDRDHYLMMEWGTNPIGKVPVAMLYSDRPKGRKFMGKSVMRDVALINKTTFNQDSEIRSVQRLCGFPLLCIPSKNPGSIKNVVLGVNSALGYNANAGEPKYVTADLQSLDVLQANREKLKEAAFGMAHLAAIVGFVQTSSGFHSEAEFEKTNKRIGRNAASLEDYEMRLARLFLNWKGYSDEQIADTPGLISISYPKSFQIRDIDALIKRTTDQLAQGLGENANRRFLTDYFSALWPRLDKKEMEDLVTEAAKIVTKLTESKANAGAPDAETRDRIARTLEAGLTNKKEVASGKAASKLTEKP